LVARAKVQRSLKSRALQILAQRDQSRLELKRKLLRHARRDAAEAEAGSDDDPAADVAAQVEALLDWLEANRFLSDERFVESRVHAREARFGNLRIRSELAQHGVAAPVELAQALEASELDRAASVRERRFAALPVDAAERAAQSRFLANRGFTPDVIHRLMRRLRASGPGSKQPRGEAD
jgi:regulatory protein